jgi:hypothetical protein
MAFTRPLYDPCEYDKTLEESTSTLSYLLDPNKHYNCNPCRIQFGIVGGNDVSIYQGNNVDLESELRGQTRAYSNCPSKKYLPGTIIQGQDSNQCKPGCGKDGLPCGSLSCRKENLRHLPACDIIQYKQKIDDVGYELKYPPCSGFVGHPVNKGAACASKKEKQYTPSNWQSQQGYEQWPKY